VAVAVGLGRLDQLLDLVGSKVFVGFAMIYALPGIATVQTIGRLRTVGKRFGACESECHTRPTSDGHHRLR
jgi:hypothetical protein